MPPTVAIIEPEREVAIALSEVVELARCTAVTIADIDELKELATPPAAIVVRVATGLPRAGAAHLSLERLPEGDRPTVVALARTDADVAEATRLGCDVVLREPRQVRALYEAIANLRQGNP
jgi:hypothetical protein